jgi:hypothetical protein
LDGQSIDTSNIGYNTQNEGNHNKINTTKKIKKITKWSTLKARDENRGSQRVMGIVSY